MSKIGPGSLPPTNTIQGQTQTETNAGVQTARFEDLATISIGDDNTVMVEADDAPRRGGGGLKELGRKIGNFFKAIGNGFKAIGNSIKALLNPPPRQAQGQPWQPNAEATMGNAPKQLTDIATRGTPEQMQTALQQILDNADGSVEAAANGTKFAGHPAKMPMGENRAALTQMLAQIPDDAPQDVLALRDSFLDALDPAAMRREALEPHLEALTMDGNPLGSFMRGNSPHSKLLGETANKDDFLQVGKGYTDGKLGEMAQFYADLPKYDQFVEGSPPPRIEGEALSDDQVLAFFEKTAEMAQAFLDMDSPHFIGAALDANPAYTDALSEDALTIRDFDAPGLSDEDRQQAILTHYNDINLREFAGPLAIDIAMNKTGDGADLAMMDVLKLYQAAANGNEGYLEKYAGDRPVAIQEAFNQLVDDVQQMLVAVYTAYGMPQVD
ncbi:hypothetical protein [Pseudooceanicola aestuarii]|uniref:hypothetical protein n=1 Tax=Pseudooceanicola aestuarii TaxID=2697319 RepID=UPI0013D8184A|nr:hypothetical protein [Pseudooceanicola aestuarii]